MKRNRTPKISEFIEGDYMLIDWKKINDFAKLTTDFNPIHTDMDYIEKKTLYNQPIAHGLIGVSLICALLGNTFKGIILKNQMIDYIKPVLINTEVRALIRCLSIKRVNETYNNIEISFYVDLRDKDENIYLNGRMVMFMWGEKR